MANQVTITLTPELKKALDDYREKMGFEKNTAAIRRLMRIALEVEAKK